MATVGAINMIDGKMSIKSDTVVGIRITVGKLNTKSNTAVVI